MKICTICRRPKGIQRGQCAVKADSSCYAFAIKTLRADLRDADLRERLAKLLTGVAEGVHGGPLKDGLWSFHDLPSLATIMRAQLVALKAPVPETSEEAHQRYPARA